MDIRIGIDRSNKEIVLELADDATEAGVKGMLEKAVNGEVAVVWLTDAKGRQIMVPAAKISYAEIDAKSGGPSIGFGAT